jgi:hypothetical protein
MGGVWFAGTRAIVRTRWVGGFAAGARVAGAVGLLVALLVALAVGAAGASAEPLCTDKWAGGSSGSWQTASSWSTGKAPTSVDVACIGAGVTVEVSGGTNAAGVLEDEGALVLGGGSLELASAFEESTVHVLTVSGGILTGAGKLGVSSSLSWKEGRMEGSGSTVLKAAASGTVDASSVRLIERRLVNEGTLTLTAGAIELESGAVLSNSGTFNLNDNERACEECYRTGLYKGSGSSSFVNTGVVRKAAGAGEAGIGVDTENLGTISGKSGPIAFLGSSNSSVLGNGSVLEGAIEIENASVAGDSFKLVGGELTLASGTLSMTGGDTATVGVLVMTGGTLTGAGTLKVTETLSWPSLGSESTMSGSGSTVLESGASGSISVSGGDDANLAKRSLLNEGTLTLASGHISLSEEAKLENRGTFKVDSEATGAIKQAGGGSGKVVNTGTVEKISGTGTSQVSVPLESSGTVEAQKGQLAFTEGGSSTSAGSWVAGEGASVALAGGSFAVSGSSWSGAIDLTGGSVTAEGVRESTGQVSIQAGTLSVAGATASTFSDLTLTNGTLDGAGTLKVSGVLEWAGEGGVMSGSGSTVLESGASGTISVGTPARLEGRSLVNDGTLTWVAGAIFVEEGAQISNSGTFYANDNGSSCGGVCRGHGIDTGSGSGTFENTGSVIESAGSEVEVEVGFDNQGSVKAETGKLKFKGGGISGHTATGSWSATGGSSTAIEFLGGTFTWGSKVGIEGSIVDEGAVIGAGDVQGSEADLQLKSGLFTLNGPAASNVSELQVLHPGGKLAGAGRLNVSSSLLWNEGVMEGSGETVLEEKAMGTIEDSSLNLVERSFVNEGQLTWASGELKLGRGAVLENRGLFLAVDEKACEECGSGIKPEKPGEPGESTGTFVNDGTVEKTGGPAKIYVEVFARNFGVIRELSGHIEFTRSLIEGEAGWGGGENPQEPAQCGEEESVSCQTGNYSQTQSDLSIGGRGVGLALGRTYNSQAAAAGDKGVFGYGWSSSFSDHLTVEKASKKLRWCRPTGAPSRSWKAPAKNSLRRCGQRTRSVAAKALATR